MPEKYTPKNIREASDFLQRNPTSYPIGKGTRIKSKKENREILVDISPLGLDYIDVLNLSEDAQSAPEVVLGATTPLNKIASSEVLKKFAGGLLSKAAQKTLDLSLAKQEATVGGEIGTGSPSSPFLSALLVLGSMVRVFSGNYADWKSLEMLYSMEGTLSLQRGEIVEEILIPSDFSKAVSSIEFIEDSSISLPVGITMCILLENHKIEDIGIAGIFLTQAPMRLDSLESKLKGANADLSSLEFPFELWEREIQMPSQISISPIAWQSIVKKAVYLAYAKCLLLN